MSSWKLVYYNYLGKGKLWQNVSIKDVNVRFLLNMFAKYKGRQLLSPDRYSTNNCCKGGGKLGQIIRLKKLFKNIWHSFRYSVHKSDWIWSTYLFGMQNEYLFKSQIMLNTVKYWAFRDIFQPFLHVFLHYTTLTNKKLIIISFDLTFPI